MRAGFQLLLLLLRLSVGRLQSVNSLVKNCKLLLKNRRLLHQSVMEFFEFSKRLGFHKGGSLVRSGTANPCVGAAAKEVGVKIPIMRNGSYHHVRESMRQVICPQWGEHPMLASGAEMLPSPV